MSGFGEDARSPFRQEPGAVKEPVRVKMRVGPGGRVVIPAAVRAAMGVKEGDTLVATLEDHELKLVTAAEAIRRAQVLVREFIPEDVNLVDEFLAERRKMWGEDD